jgi:glycosyltransferase involved in cell wall biosynthesis
MKPILSVIYPKNVVGFLDSELSEGVERICIDGDMNEIDAINMGILNSTGDYIAILRNGDVPLPEFVDKIKEGIGSNRDIVVFNTINSNGDITKYSSLPKRTTFEKEISLKPQQYFHVYKSRLMKMVMFRKDDRVDPFVLFSKKIATIAFTEQNINETLLLRD